MKKIIALILISILCLSFVSCGKNDDPETPEIEETPGIEEALSEEEKAILGKWSSGGYYSFVFYEDGTGKFADEYDFKWKYDEDLTCYILCLHQFGTLAGIYSIEADEEGARYFIFEGCKCYFQAE